MEDFYTSEILDAFSWGAPYNDDYRDLQLKDRMFFIVTKLKFENQRSPGDARELSQLVDKVRQKFRISVQIADEFHKSGEAGIVVAAVHHQEEALSRMIDDIADLCENSGFGRIDSEHTILEDFEAYSDTFE